MTKKDSLNKHILFVLKKEIPVHFIYWTIQTDIEGNLVFLDDVYQQHDVIVKTLSPSPSLL